MSRLTALERLRRALYPMVRQNTLSDDLLRGPATETGILDGSLDVFARGGLFLEPYTVRVQANSGQVTQEVPTGETARNWTTRFKVNDEIVIGGSLSGQSGSYRITAVNPTSLVVDYTFKATESGLQYAKATYKLLREAQSLMLLPSGFETDTELRALLLDAIGIHQRRGSTAQAISELETITRQPVTPLESQPDLDLLASGLSYTQSTKKLANTGNWATTPSAGTAVSLGDSIIVTGSGTASDGRYTVYDLTNGVTLGRRAVNVRSYPTLVGSETVEVQFREERELKRLYWRVVNGTVEEVSVTATLLVTGATSSLINITPGFTLPAPGGVWTATWTVPAGGVVEAALQMINPTPLSTFQTSVTAGPVTAIRLGEACLSTRLPDGGTQLTDLPPWRWGGVIQTGLLEGADASDLSVYRYGLPGWFLMVSAPDQPENDAYTIASPDEYAVLEVDHRNSANYSEADLAQVTLSWLTPADTDVLLGFL